MIKKQRTKSLKLLKLEVILNRLLLNHPSMHDIRNEYSKSHTGHIGEESLDFHLSELQHDVFDILHDLRLLRVSSKKYYFQIDCLLVHPQFCLLLEVKNMIGDLYFDHQFDQMIRTRNGVKETFSDPVIQVELQKEYFAKWLIQNKFSKIPLYTLVVITNPRSHISLSPLYEKAKAEKIVRGRVLASKIREFINTPSDIILEKKDMNRLSAKLFKQHEPNNSDLLSIYNIHPDDIQTGVICPYCGNLPMIRTYGNWFCSSCQKRSKTAHIQAIQDYSLLFDKNVKNKALRKFLHISSRNSMKKLLFSMGILPGGNTNSATYKLPLPK
ncbi:nuclease-related domain-containing protein [Bacillus sp. NEB1478]|uniref:nuclease-related domain-containing protein n=1 Tax=Bacillus sp. NEB1478 TaxID=3073816 RepID=UPI0028730717|nr:nuclease-related domain-containing protein [Bacillus sp. NEB1478]WNB91686.1 nuclease-related domain-containing protein [Bacillus sp. NEB1478]